MRDYKLIIAYSSIVHIAPILYLLFTNTSSGYNISLMMCLTHGLTSFGLFFFFGGNSKKENRRNLHISKNTGFVDVLILSAIFSLIIMNRSMPPFFRFSTELATL